MKCFRVTIATLLTAILSGLAPSTSAEIRVDPIATIGDELPVPGEAAYLKSFGWPLINAKGEVVFSGALKDERGVEFERSWAVWKHSGDTFELIAREGDDAPGLPEGDTIGTLSAKGISETGDVYFSSRIDESYYALWRRNASGTQLVVRGGTPIPGLGGGAVFDQRFDLSPHVLQADTLVFKSSVNGGVASGRQGLWYGQPGAIKALAIDRAAEFELDGILSSFTEAPVVNARGQFVLPGMLAPNKKVIYAGSIEDPKVILGPGITPPDGGRPGVQFYSNTHCINNKGQIAFVTTRGLYFGTADEFRLKYTTGGVVPGIDGAKLNGFGRVVLDGKGQLWFMAGLSGNTTPDNNTALFVDRGKGAELVLRACDPAPGAGPGIRFGSFGGLGRADLQTSPNGTVALNIKLVGEGVSNNNARSVWMIGQSGKPQLVVREGEQIDLDPDPAAEDLQTVRSISSQFSRSGGEDGRPRIVNDRGEIVLSLIFRNKDKSGIYRFHDVTPTPSPGPQVVDKPDPEPRSNPDQETEPRLVATPKVADVEDTVEPSASSGTSVMIWVVIGGLVLGVIGFVAWLIRQEKRKAQAKRQRREARRSAKISGE